MCGLMGRAAWKTRKNGGRREPEYRLWCLVPALVMSPCGLIIYVLCAYYKLHWIGMFFGVGLYQASNFHGFSILIAYMVLPPFNQVNDRSTVIIVIPLSYLVFSLPAR